MPVKTWVVGAAVLAAIVAGVLAWAPWAVPQGEDAAALRARTASQPAGPVVALPTEVGDGGVPSQAASSPAQASSNPLDHVILPVFRATARGQLAMDPQTRLDVERIHALFGRDEAQMRLDEASSQLPDKARRELKELYQQYNQYAQAVAQTYPPGEGNESLDDAARQLSGLHELRHQYFGAERADLMFGEEERISRELLVLMRQSNDPNLSLGEKAALAQEIYKKSHPPQP